MPIGIVGQPLQPANTDNESLAVAVSVTAFVLLMVPVVLVHWPEVAPEVIVQLMPPMLLATDPLPVPAPVTVTVVALKAALTDFAASTVGEQAPVPVQAPPHPTNENPAGALGVRVTTVPLMKLTLQVAPQLI